MSIEDMKQDIIENKVKLGRIDVMLRGNGGSTGMKAQVEKNTDFIAEIKNYVRAAVIMFMAQGVVIIIWAISQMN